MGQALAKAPLKLGRADRSECTKPVETAGSGKPTKAGALRVRGFDRDLRRANGIMAAARGRAASQVEHMAAPTSNVPKLDTSKNGILRGELASFGIYDWVSNGAEFKAAPLAAPHLMRCRHSWSAKPFGACW